MRGKFIVIEGLEGAGKSTAVDCVQSYLLAHGKQVVVTREPGGTMVGEVVRELIKDPRYQDNLEHKTELLLFYAARVQLLQEVILPALERGDWVVADRFELSSFAYQGGGRGINFEFIQSLSAFCLEGFQPDLTLYLEISPELGMQRVSVRGSLDRMERQSLDFFHQVHGAYQQQLKLHPEIVQIKTETSLQAVHQAIEQALAELL
jgi:dTMP kinase